jgi:L-iditol 2-dehydrogenase
VPLRKAALAELLACGWHAVRLGSTILDMPLRDAKCHVIGGGAIGVGAALALRAFGATQITVATQRRAPRNADRIDGLTLSHPVM